MALDPSIEERALPGWQIRNELIKGVDGFDGSCTLLYSHVHCNDKSGRLRTRIGNKL